MITRKLIITDVTYDLEDEKVREARFFGKTNTHQFMRQLMEQHAGSIVRIISYDQYEKTYQIEEEVFIKNATEIKENEHE